MPSEKAKQDKLQYTLVERAPVPVFVLSGNELRIEYLNRAALLLLDKQNEQVTGTTFNQLLPGFFSPADRDTILEKCTLRGESVCFKGKQIELLQYSQSPVRWMDVDCEPMIDESQNVFGVVCYLRDVTPERILQTSLDSRSDYLNNFFKSAPIAIVCYRGPRFIVDVANDNALAMWGKSSNQVIGKSVEDIFPHMKSDPEIWERHLESVARMERGEGHVVNEVELAFVRNGVPHTGWYTYIHEPYTDSSGKIIGTMAIAIEVTEQVAARKKLQLITDSLPSLISYINDKEQYSFVNKAHESWFGKDRNDITGQDVASIVGNAYQELGPQIKNALLGTPAELEGWVDYKNKGRKYITANFIPHQNENKTVLGLVSLVNDLTERKLQEEAIHETDERLRLITEAINAGTFDYDIEKETLHWSPQLKKIIGLRAEQVVTKDLSREVIHPEDRDIILSQVDATVSNGDQDYVSVDYRIIKQDTGEVRWMHTRTKTFYRNVEGRRRAFRMLGFTIDITESKTNEELLRKFNTHLEQQVHARTKELSDLNHVLAEAQKVSKLGSWEWDVTSNQVRWSDEMYSIYGYDEKFEVDFTRATERMSAADASLSKQRSDIFVKEAYEQFKINGTRSFDIPPVEFKIQLPDYTEKVLRNSGKIFLTQDGKLEKILGAVQDVTEIRATEHQLQIAVEQLEIKNKELEAFSYVASHDLKEPLRKIITFAGLVKQGDQSAIDRYLGKIDDAANRMMDLIESVLRFSQLSNQSVDYKEIDLNLVLENCKSDLEVRIRDTGAIITSSNLGRVKANLGQMNQLFSNLIGNSMKFCSGTPLINITLERIENHQGAFKSVANGTPHWCLRFSDNGIGFDLKYKEQVFEPFKRLHGKTSYSGTGIGLSIVKKIVEHHNGHIEVDSAPGKGTRFTIYLPAV